MKINIKTQLDFKTQALEQKFAEVAEMAQKKLDAQVLKDSNFYVPLDTSMLQKSGILHTVIGSGYVIWHTDYARNQYYNDYDHSKQRNPNACMKWFEVAKSTKLDEWEKLVKNEYKRHFK